MKSQVLPKKRALISVRCQRLRRADDVQAIPNETLHYTLPSRKEATQLQSTIRNHLDQLWKHGVAPVIFSDLTLIITAPGMFHARHGSLLISTKPKVKEFEYRVAVLLAEYAGRIRPCEECQRIFLAARCDQLFCTTRCQMRVASQNGERRKREQSERSIGNGAQRWTRSRSDPAKRSRWMVGTDLQRWSPTMVQMRHQIRKGKPCMGG